MVDREERIQKIHKRLRELHEEKRLLERELANLMHEDPSHAVTNISSSEEKIALFLSLFRCREDRYPYYYERKRDGKSGFNPACYHEWEEEVCGKKFKPRIPCSQCKNFLPIPFSVDTAEIHLTGAGAIGSYSIDQQDRCVFIAADFDAQNWKHDAFAYRQTAYDMGIDAAVEVSKSGNGAHVWIFFSELVQARSARRLGELILSRTLDTADTLVFDSYDRFFPNQDYCPGAGFGNLIFLPLQKRFRAEGTTVFIGEDGNPLPDQWAYLSSLHRISGVELEDLLAEETLHPLHTGDEIEASESFLQQYQLPLLLKYSGTVTMILKGQIAIPRNQLPVKLLKVLMKQATIANPIFFQQQKLRFSTWNIPKYIFCGTSDEQYIYLPRALKDTAVRIITNQGMKVDIRDDRNKGTALGTCYTGTLYDYQKPVVERLAKIDMGVLEAPTGTGKTVMAVAVIAERDCSTLILVHRSTLIEQWMDTLTTYLEGVDKKYIGVLGAGRKKLKGKIDIAMLQSLARKEDLEELTKDYALVIVDECHRVPTVSFEPILQSIAARFVLGLTATPKRKDQLEPIIFMHCGEIAARLDDMNRLSQKRIVHILDSGLPSLPDRHSVPELWDIICRSEPRNNLIVDTIIDVTSEMKSPLVISDRVDHLLTLQALLSERAPGIKSFQLTGSVRKKARRRIFEEFSSYLNEGNPCCLFATGSLIGEGFDLPALDTMILTMPISFSERLIQYVGRLHRPSGNSEKEVTVYDIEDTLSGMTVSMFRKRLSVYRKLGYRVGNCSVKNHITTGS